MLPPSRQPLVKRPHSQAGKGWRAHLLACWKDRISACCEVRRGRWPPAPTRMAGTANPPGCLAPRVSMVRPSFGSCPQQMIGSTSRMQGKEASEQETRAKSNVGIDVSQDWLDVHVLPAGEALR